MTPSALPSTNSVLPPPRSTTRTRVLAAGGQDAAGAGEGQRGFLVAGDHFGFDAEEVADAVDEDLPVAGVAGGRGRDEADLLGPVLADQPGVVRGGGEGAVQGFLRELAGGVHALAEPDDAHFAHDVGEPGQSAAVRFRHRR